MGVLREVAAEEISYFKLLTGVQNRHIFVELFNDRIIQSQSFKTKQNEKPKKSQKGRTEPQQKNSLKSSNK
jgi:hypothetical protein